MINYRYRHKKKPRLCVCVRACVSMYNCVWEWQQAIWVVYKELSNEVQRAPVLIMKTIHLLHLIFFFLKFIYKEIVSTSANLKKAEFIIQVRQV